MKLGRGVRWRKATVVAKLPRPSCEVAPPTRNSGITWVATRLGLKAAKVPMTASCTPALGSLSAHTNASLASSCSPAGMVPAPSSSAAVRRTVGSGSCKRLVARALIPGTQMCCIENQPCPGRVHQRVRPANNSGKKPSVNPCFLAIEPGGQLAIPTVSPVIPKKKR